MGREQIGWVNLGNKMCAVLVVFREWVGVWGREGVSGIIRSWVRWSTNLLGYSGRC